MVSKSGFFIFRLSCFLILACFNSIFAQTTVSDTSFYQRVLATTRAHYQQSFGEQSALYNGTNGDYLFPFEKGYPYFYSVGPGIGSVVYDGINYDSVIMNYDEVKDALIVLLGVKRLQLASEKVERFRVFNSDFINIQKDSISNGEIKSGFYNVLYKGNVWVLKKQIKTVIEDISTMQILRMIDEQDYYYIKKEGKYFIVKNKKSLLKIFSDKKKEMQQFIRAKGLNFKSNRKQMLVETAAYYDSLKK